MHHEARGDEGDEDLRCLFTISRLLVVVYVCVCACYVYYTMFWFSVFVLLVIFCVHDLRSALVQPEELGVGLDV